MKISTPAIVQVSLTRYAPFAGSSNHGKRLNFKMQCDKRDLPDLRRMFTARGAVIGRIVAVK